MIRVIILRHAESMKNREDIYGGKGKILTEEGKKNIEILNQKLQQKFDLKSIPKITIYSSCERVHVVDTCQKIADFFKISNIEFDKRYSPIRLGIFDNLSKQEQLLIFPEAVRALENWNNGIGDINEFQVEGLESATSHYNRLNNFLNSLENNQFYILIGTRSDISALKNIVFGNSPEIYMQYKYYETDFLSGLYFEMDCNHKIGKVEEL